MLITLIIIHLAEKTYPRIDFIDKVTPDNPLIIANKSGHNGVFNSLAMEGLGITADTPNPRRWSNL